MPLWTSENLAQITGGQWLDAPFSSPGTLTGLSTDTRTLKAGNAYLALRGERFDGHAFVAQAGQAGASLAIVDSTAHTTNAAIPRLAVADTLCALQTLARASRDCLAQSGCQVIAVGGSNGKTTTRHLIHTVLTAGGLIGTQSPRSFNNHIGVPLTLLGAQAGHDFVVVEVGTNHPGEIADLAQMVRPDLAVITSIGREHLEAFGDVDAVAQEEYRLLDHLQPNGWSITPRRPPPPYEGPLGLTGAHNRSNAAVAAAVGRHSGIGGPTIRQALAGVQPLAGRSRVLQFFGNITVLDDTYNSNPDSALAALALLGQTPASRRVAVLGEMGELGQASPTAHREIADQARRVTDARVLIGNAFADHRDNDDWHEQLTAQLVEQIASAIGPGDAVLLKGSRSVGLERLVLALEKRFAQTKQKNGG